MKRGRGSLVYVTVCELEAVCGDRVRVLLSPCPLTDLPFISLSCVMSHSLSFASRRHSSPCSDITLNTSCDVRASLKADENRPQSYLAVAAMV